MYTPHSEANYFPLQASVRLCWLWNSDTSSNSFEEYFGSPSHCKRKYKDRYFKSVLLKWAHLSPAGIYYKKDAITVFTCFFVGCKKKKKKPQGHYPTWRLCRCRDFKIRRETKPALNPTLCIITLIESLMRNREAREKSEHLSLRCIAASHTFSKQRKICSTSHQKHDSNSKSGDHTALFFWDTLFFFSTAGGETPPSWGLPAQQKSNASCLWTQNNVRNTFNCKWNRDMRLLKLLNLL